MKYMKWIFAIILLPLSMMAQGNPPCFNTPFFATGGNWFIPMVGVNQETCFLDQCQPIVAMNALDFDAPGFKVVKVVAPNSHVSGVFTTYTCDSVLSVQCDGVIGDTAVFELAYTPPCLLFFVSDAVDTIFAIPGPDSTGRLPQPYVCSLTSIQEPGAGESPPLYTHYLTGASTGDHPAEPGVWIRSWPADPWRKPEKIVILR